MVNQVHIQLKITSSNLLLNWKKNWQKFFPEDENWIFQHQQNDLYNVRRYQLDRFITSTIKTTTSNCKLLPLKNVFDENYHVSLK